MTDAALSGGDQMCWVLADGCRTVMTVAATADHLQVIDTSDRRKRDHRVAVLAHIGRLNVGCRFAKRIDIVVATNAVTDDVVVVEVCGDPAVSRVAVVATVAAYNMGGTLAECRRTIVAAIASAEHLQMIDARHDRRKSDDCVTVFTDVRSLNMRCWLADRIHIVVAADAIAANRVVIEICRDPADSGVTVVATIATGNVPWVPAQRSRPIVAAAARAEHLQMIDARNWGEGDDRVAILADTGCRDVCCGPADCIDCIVATCTVADYGIVIEVCWDPAISRMAVVASVAAYDMARVLAERSRPIVAAAARAKHL